MNYEEFERWFDESGWKTGKAAKELLPVWKNIVVWQACQPEHTLRCALRNFLDTCYETNPQLPVELFVAIDALHAAMKDK